MPKLGLPLIPAQLRWTGLIFVAGAIFTMSIVIVPPGPPSGDPGPFWDKKLHLVAYAALTISLAYATAQSVSNPVRRIISVIVLSVTYGVTIELLQAPLPDRYFSYADMLANAVGALLGSMYFVAETRIPYVRLRDLL